MWCLMKISPANIFQKMLWFEKYYQNCQASFGRSKCEWVKTQGLCNNGCENRSAMPSCSSHWASAFRHSAGRAHKPG